MLYYPLTKDNRSIVLVYRNVTPSSTGTITSATDLSFRITSDKYSKFEIEGVGISGGKLYFNREPGEFELRLRRSPCVQWLRRGLAVPRDQRRDGVAGRKSGAAQPGIEQVSCAYPVLHLLRPVRLRFTAQGRRRPALSRRHLGELSVP